MKKFSDDLIKKVVNKLIKTRSILEDVLIEMDINCPEDDIIKDIEKYVKQCSGCFSWYDKKDVHAIYDGYYYTDYCDFCADERCE